MALQAPLHLHTHLHDSSSLAPTASLPPHRAARNTLHGGHSHPHLRKKHLQYHCPPSSHTSNQIWFPRPLRSLRRRSRVMAPTAQTAKSVTEVENSEVSGKAISPLQLTYLEGNSWLWEVTGVQVLVDPVLVGNLDFGIPWLYDASKKKLKEFTLEDLPELDLLLITQSLDDHCHKRTLEPLSKIFPNLQVISTPNAEPILGKIFQKVIYLEPGHSTRYRGSNGSEITICASAGPILGPPWQRPENGYFLESQNPQFNMYYEPHCVYNRSLLERERADVIITPVIKQVLPAFTLVSGQEDAVELAQLLRAKFVVAMKNGDLESKGLLSKIVFAVGSIENFRDLLQKTLPNVQLLEPNPGIPLKVPLSS